MNRQDGLLIVVAEFDRLQGAAAERTLDLLKQSAVQASIDFDDSWSLSHSSAGAQGSDLKQFLQSRLREPRTGPVILYLYGRMTLLDAEAVITTSFIADQPEQQSAVALSHLLNLLKHAQSPAVCLALEVVVEPDSLTSLETRLNYLFA